MSFVIEIANNKNLVRRIIHKLFQCPTFWIRKPRFECPICGEKYRCYWDGNDIDGHGINICNKCAKKIQPGSSADVSGGRFGLTPSTPLTLSVSLKMKRKVYETRILSFIFTT